MVSSGLAPAVLCHFSVGGPEPYRALQARSQEQGTINSLDCDHTAFGAAQDTYWPSRSRGILERKVSDRTDADKMPWKRHDMLCFQL